MSDVYVNNKHNSAAKNQRKIVIGQYLLARAEYTGVRFPLAELTGRTVKKHCKTMLFLHGPSTRPELTGVQFPLPVNTGRQHGPCSRVMETAHPSIRAVYSGRELG